MSDPYYTSRYTWDKNRETVWREIVRFLNPYLNKAHTVVDLGAGYCDFINNISARKRIAIDISPDCAKYAGDGVEVFRTPVTKLSAIPDTTVDVVFASNLLEHLDDKELELLMSELKRVLVPGGQFIVMQPNYYYAYRTYFDDPTHKKVFSHESLKNFLIANGFMIEIMKEKFLPFSFKTKPSIIPIFPFIVRMYLHSPWKPFAGQMLCISNKIPS